MLKTRLLHPEILHVLAAAGHGSQLLVTDGNFSNSTLPPRDTPRVYLNLAPGCVSVSDVLSVLLASIPVEAAALIDPEDGHRPAAHDDLESMLPAGIRVDHLPRFEFYKAVRSDSMVLVIATGDERTFANVLLTIGVIDV